MHRFIIHTIIICSIHLCAWAQDAGPLLKKSREFQLVDLDSSSWYATQAYRLALDKNQHDLALKSQLILGRNFQKKGAFEQAVAVYKQLLTSTPEDTYPEEYVQAYGRIGDCYTNLGAFDSAMVYLIQFDQLVDHHWSPNKIDAKLFLGELYRAMGRIDQSDQYKIEAIRRSEKSGNTMERMIALHYYLDDHKHELQSEGFQKYFQDYARLMNARSISKMDFSHVTMFLEDLNKQDKIDALENAVKEGSDLGYLSTILIFRASLIDIYLEDGDFSKALEHAEKGILLTDRVDDKRFKVDFNRYLFKIHEGLQNYDKAIYFLQAHHEAKDSLEDIQVSKNIDELSVQYETAKKENQIKQQQLELQKSRYQRNLLLGGLAMVLWFGGFLIFYLLNRNRVTKRLSLQEAHIQAQKINQLEQEKSLLAMSSMIEGQEAERKRIAQDLHDGLGGLLSNIKAQLHDIERRVDALSGINLYGKASEMIDKASKEVRRIAYNMMPVTLSRLGLKAAIEDLTVNLTQNHPLILETQLMGLEKRLKESQEVMLYRIVQELCNNVIKHAEATTLMIQTNRIENDLIIVVEDNGKGFDLNSKDHAPGIGIKSLESRVEYLKGNLDISSSKGGTCVTVQVPVS
jgi:signal transduction histidine kinase